MTDARSGSVIDRNERDKMWDRATEDCETAVFSDQLEVYSVRLLATFAERVAVNLERRYDWELRASDGHPSAAQAYHEAARIVREAAK